MRPNPAEWAQYTKNFLGFRAICRSTSTCSKLAKERCWPRGRPRFHLLAGYPRELVTPVRADAGSERHNPADLQPGYDSFPKTCALGRGW